MDMENRYLRAAVLEDLKEKMVFLAGPRQVGKTTFARDLIGAAYPSTYFNWDKIAERQKALKGQWPPESRLIILDEFHKYKRWKNWLKGEYDTQSGRYKFLLTGSARLDLYRRGGDSMMGRYHLWRMHPFSVAELRSKIPAAEPGKELVFSQTQSDREMETLLRYGGFPEPFLKQGDRFLRRWHGERMERLFKEDVRDLTQIQDLGNLSLLAELLPQRASSIVSINNLAQDLQVNFRTVARWLDAFETFYYCFRLPPFRTRRIAAVRKEKKLYLWDWSQIGEPGARLENLAASHLLKFCHWLRDWGGWPVDLTFVRDSTGRETDFLVANGGKPWFAVEVKNSERPRSKHLLYFKEKLGIPFCYQIATGESKEYVKDGVRVMPASKFLAALV
jgi:predicted AAA+ superfamily ATPase